MKIGIHQTKGLFSERWLAYCELEGINYKVVDCYRTDIIEQLEDCDALMWHFSHKSPKASKFAKQLISAVAASGKKVFPDYNTVWHFDDKVAQKYLLESIGAPLVKSYVFYSKKDGLTWAENTIFPKVFKLRNGAGSDNVRLVKNVKKARHLIRKSFGSGFVQYDGLSNLKERYRKYRIGKTTGWDVVKGVIRLFHKTEYSRVAGKEIGYAYFQEFIPDNTFDIRVIVIGDRAFAIKRMVRKNDFRASGSGFIRYEKENFSETTVKIAFTITERLGAQCMAYDFVYQADVPMIVEISYGFVKEVYDECTGYWDRELNWYPGRFNPYGWMVDDLITSLNNE